MSSKRTVIALGCLAALSGCPKPPGGSDGGPADAGPVLDGPAALGGLSCDPLSTACGYPFPSDVYLVDHRVAFGASTLPFIYRDAHMDPAYYADLDGFSPNVAPMTYLEGATVTGCARLTGIGDSLAAGSPTVIIEAETGARVPHWVELDQTSPEPSDQAFMLRPAVRLKDGTRYIVALRGVVNGAGAALPAGPVFAALRDGTPSDDRSVEPRRQRYADLFAKLAAVGVGKSDLQLAWDFTTASKQAITGRLVAMRDEALALVGADGPEYTITSTVDNPNTYIARRIEGTMRVPLYLNQPGPGARLNLVGGRPTQNGFADFPFLVQVPNSVATDTVGAPVVQQGHGLLGDRREGANSYFAHLAQQKKYVTIAVNLIGMSEEDTALIQQWLTGDLGQFQSSIDRQQQGLLNSLLAMRMMKGRFAREAQMQFNGHSAIDPSHLYYRGDSQGGIFGVTYMALSTDVTRGYLGEPGMPYSVVLYRSRDFTDFFVILKNTYNTAVDMQLTMGLLQMLWDRTEPGGYAPYITSPNASERLPNTPQHQVLIGDALGDYQVTPISAHILARAVGAKHLGPVNRPIYGLDVSATPVTGGSGLIEFDYHLPEAPLGNVPPTGPGFPDGSDPHEKVRRTQAIFNSTDTFFRTGVAQSYCAGACDGTTEPPASP